MESQVVFVSFLVALLTLLTLVLCGVALRRDRARADRLRESEARYRLIVENQTEFVVKWLPDGSRTFVNESYCRYFGVDEEGCLGTSFLPLVAPEFHDAILRKIEALTPARPEATDEHLSFVAGGGLRWQEWNDRGIFDGEGRLVELISTGRDISDRKELETQLRQSQKMEAVGQLAGGVAHDFNNILTVIGSHSEILLARTNFDDATRQSLVEIRDAAARAATLTRQLLAVSRQSVLEMKVLDLNQQIGEAEKMMRRLIGEDIQLIIRRGGGLDRIQADPGQIHQVLMNLILNARDAMPRGGELVVETAGVESETEGSENQGQNKPGRFVRLTVGDTGCGMAPEVVARIFEPFYTTKSPGKGTGLGLSVVHGIVEQSGGHIAVESTPGQGSTFKVYFPGIAEPASVAGDSNRPQTAAQGGTETLLLVEDEEAVRKASQMVLQTRGYNVLTAASGEEASQIIADHAGQVDLLLTDVVMPGMSGRELADVLQSDRPDLKVLFMSGYTSDAILRHGIMHGAANFLEKPFTPVTLAGKVRTVLDHPIVA